MVSFTKFFFAIAAAGAAVSALPTELDLDASEIELLDSDLEYNGTEIDLDPVIEPRARKHHGDLTYYAPGLGACGVVNTGSDPIVAISHLIFDPRTPGGNPNNNPLCGRKIKIHRNGKTITVTVRDRCEGCDRFDLDVPKKQFAKLAKPRLGRVKMNWNWA
ncbi:RlpA-like double-psi beta-barrel-protein domain-containing protein-containing protein [Xylaria sp. FL1042]|nr:RlpA-like double-psi beta-barrel-protein domain-containing protein-containing protein [Xylaria sp. FL1042]